MRASQVHTYALSAISCSPCVHDVPGVCSAVLTMQLCLPKSVWVDDNAMTMAIDASTIAVCDRLDEEMGRL